MIDPQLDLLDILNANGVSFKPKKCSLFDAKTEEILEVKVQSLSSLSNKIVCH